MVQGPALSGYLGAKTGTVTVQCGQETSPMGDVQLNPTCVHSEDSVGDPVFDKYQIRCDFKHSVGSCMLAFSYVKRMHGGSNPDEERGRGRLHPPILAWS